MIVRDEAAVLARCLQSVRGVADEIVVVDTGSTDATISIAREYGATVGVHQWRDHFAAARNMSLSMATKRWILWMDADDELDPESVENVRYLKAREETAAYRFMVRNVDAEGGASLGITTFAQLRMFPRHKDVRFRGAVVQREGNDVALEGRLHEQVTFDIKRLGIPVYRCSDVWVNHHGYKEEAHNIQKLFRNNRLRLIEMGYPEGTRFYTFQTSQGYLCLYAPNTLSVWRRMVMVAAVDPFEHGWPVDVEVMKRILRGRGEQLGAEADRSRLGTAIDIQKTAANLAYCRAEYPAPPALSMLDALEAAIDMKIKEVA